MIIRVLRKEQSFTVLDNQLLSDDRLSFKARGILAYLLSKPPSWRPCIAELAAQGQEGRVAIASAFKELKRAGYAWMEVYRSEDKKQLAGRCWVISEVPRLSSNHPEMQETCTTGNQALVKKEEEKRKTNARADARFVRDDGEGFDVFEEGRKQVTVAIKFARSFAKWTVKNRLHVGQRGSTKHGWKTPQVKAWAMQATTLLEQLEHNLPRLKEVWRWYQVHWQDDFVPQARSVRTFSEKFLSIERCMKTRTATRPEDMDDGEVELVTNGRWTSAVRK